MDFPVQDLLINASGVNSEGGLVVFDDILHTIIQSGRCNVSVLTDSARQESIAIEHGLSGSSVIRTRIPRWAHPFLHFLPRYKDLAARFDLVLHLGNFAPRFGGKNLVFMQNLLPFEDCAVRTIPGAYRFKDRILKVLIERSLRRAELVIVQSAHVRRALRPLTDRRIVVIPPDLRLDGFFRKETAYGIITITNEVPYKQAAFACKVLSRVNQMKPDLRITVVGVNWPQQFPGLCFVNQITRPVMLGLMVEHSVLFHASLVETLGLPIVEAQKMGLDVVVPDLDYAHSVCSGRTLFFDPMSPDDACDKMLKYVGGVLVPPFVAAEKNDPDECNDWPALLSKC